MFAETEGIIFKQVKIVNGRRMLLLFSKKYGKISAGTNMNEKGKTKSSLALRPFTYGKYEVIKNREIINIQSAEVVKSYYRIGEDIEKYMSCSYVLEFTEKILEEEEPAPKLFRLLLDFFEMIERRTKRYHSLVLAYQIKALQEVGNMPEVNQCVVCGKEDDIAFFCIKEGGIVCRKCNPNLPNITNDTLIYPINFGIVNILRFILSNPLSRLEHLALDEKVEVQLSQMIRSYIAYHLDIGELKSESFLFD